MIAPEVVAAPRHAAARFKERLAARARELGFDRCGIASPDAIPQAEARLERWLAAGAHGDMDWMAATRERRGTPRRLWADVRSIVMLGMNYGPDGDPLASLAEKTAATISVYARHRDYHELIKGRLKHLAGWIVAQAPSPLQVKVFVDTAPVMEKPLAQAAGIGWQGKHTNLVSRDFGSWLFLGSIFTTLNLDADAAEADHCGGCHACLDICPTAAFPAPYQLDARRCISYLTIEHEGHIARALRPLIGNRVYGCDDCLAICPWNKFASLGREAKLAARPDLVAPPLAALAELDETAFRRTFAGSPVKRIGPARFLRNVLIAIGNSGDRGLAAAACRRLGHASPLVRAMAIWAAARLLPADAFAALAASHGAGETDADVAAEWQAGLQQRGASI